MTKRIRLAFFTLSLSPVGGGRSIRGQALLQIVSKALISSRVQPVTKGSNAVRWFMSSSEDFHIRPDLLGGHLAWGLGGTYPGVNIESKAIEPTNRPVPEFEGRVFFIVDGSGLVVLQSSKSPYIGPDGFEAQLISEIRRDSNFELNVNVSGLTLQESFDTTLAFFQGLDTVTEIEFTQLRRANPHALDDFMNETAKARVTRVLQSSDSDGGIDKNHPRILAELSHVRNYARFSKVSGYLNGRPTEIRVTADRTEISVTADSADEAVLAKTMLETASRVMDKLKRTKPPPI